jgi:hypothetical protein
MDAEVAGSGATVDGVEGQLQSGIRAQQGGTGINIDRGKILPGAHRRVG